VRTSEFTTKATTPQGDSEDFAAKLNVKLWVVVVVVVVTGAAAPSGAAEKKEKPSRKSVNNRIHRISARDFAHVGGPVR
jgi:hypothetical protein